MKVVSSEFTFGFAFLHEQANMFAGKLTAAPLLPSLLQENKLGYDAKLPTRGAVYYYQFKLSEYMVRSNAREWPCYGSPYFRFGLHPPNRHEQHRRLRTLASREPHVYYVAPECETPEAFDAAYLDQAVTDCSRLIPLRQCLDIHDGNRHRITFVTGNDGFLQHSEPKPSRGCVLGRRLLDFYKSKREEWVPIDLAFARALLEKLGGLLLDAMRDEEGEAQISRSWDSRGALRSFLVRSGKRGSVSAVLSSAQYLLSAFVGASMVLVGEGGSE